MKILQQWIVKEYNAYQLLVYCGGGDYYITTTGAFGQRDMTWINIPPSHAESLIKDKDSIPKDY